MKLYALFVIYTAALTASRPQGPLRHTRQGRPPFHSGAAVFAPNELVATSNATVQSTVASTSRILTSSKPSSTALSHTTTSAASATSPAAATSADSTTVAATSNPLATSSSATDSALQTSSSTPSLLADGVASIAEVAEVTVASVSPYTNSLTCTTVPSTFSPSTVDNFSTICSLRYCTAEVVGNMVWSSPADTTYTSSSVNPAVTREEVESALGMLSNVAPVLTTGTTGNIMADGAFGQGAYNAGLLLEMTGDVRALDIVLRMAENILALRNNVDSGEIMWTGNREAVWPTEPADPNNITVLPYAGCEQGDILGHMVNAALYILKTPCLWDMVPPYFPDYTGPTVFHASATYLDRALTLVEAGDYTVKTYFLPWFFTSNYTMIQPNDSRWLEVGDSSNEPGAPMPWNRRMLMLHGIHRLAAAHETSQAYNATLTSLYDQIIKINMAEFVADLQSTDSASGSATYNWDYVHLKTEEEEVKGVHGYFDIWGVWMAWQRKAALYGITDLIATTFANTFEDTINLQNDSFSGLVDGLSITGAAAVPALWGGWSFFALWRPEWFTTMVEATTTYGFNGGSWLALPLLWTKHAMNVQSDEFWTGYVSSGAGTIPGAASS